MRKSSLLWDTEGKRNRLYGRRWREARSAFLSAHPTCGMCESAGKLNAATVVDHIIPHKGSEALFWDQSNWQSLCAFHHNSEKASLEIRGYSTRIGEDGWPIDPSHPGISGVEMISGRSKPDGLKRLRVPAVIVCGPPAAGKSTFCVRSAGSDDTIIDFDSIDAEINGRSRMRGRLIVPILRERNRRIIEAATQTVGRVWLPMTLPLVVDRHWWRAAIGAETVVIEADADLCKQRIIADLSRASLAEKECAAVDRWWHEYRRDSADALLDATGGVSKTGMFLSDTRTLSIEEYLVSVRKGTENGA